MWYPKWKSCKHNPPPKYQRVEIRDKFGKRYFGFYNGNGEYLTSKDKNIIKYAKQWRELPCADRTWDEENIRRLLFPASYVAWKEMLNEARN